MTTTSETRAEQRRIAGRAGIVASGTLLSRILGLVREQVLAALFTRAETDVFFVAFLIPNVLRQLFAEGAVQTGVLPVLSQVKQQRGDAAARELFRALRGLSLLLLTLVTACGVLAAPWLVELFAGGYREYGEQFDRTVNLTRWVFPYILCMGTAALGSAALNSSGRFVVAAYAPGLLNVAFIACALLLPGWFRNMGIEPLHALSVGVLLGGVLQVIAQWPSLRRIGYLTAPKLDWTQPDVREVLRRMGPTLLGFGIYYVDVVAARHLLSNQGVGAQSYFAFAQRLCDFPQGIFVMAVQTATLPSLSRLAALGQTEELKETFRHGARLSLFVAIPASLLFATLAEPLVALIFGHGQFGGDSINQTALALCAQASGIWCVSLVRQLVIVFYATGDTRTPVLVSGLDFLAFLGAALLLRDSYGHVGISWAVSFASLVQVGLLMATLRRRVGALGLANLGNSAARVLLASAGAAIVTHYLGVWLHSSSWPPTWATLAQLSAFALGFFGFARAFGCAELELISAPLRSRLSAVLRRG